MAYEVVNAADLPQETSTTLDGTEQLIGFDTAQGKRITVAELAEYILQRKLSSLAGSSQTVAAALAALNSKSTGTIAEIEPESVLTVTQGGLGSFAEKYGRVVHFIAMVRLADTSSDLANETVIFRLPSDLRPSRLSIFTVRQFSKQGNIIGCGYINRNGEAYISQGGITATSSNLVCETWYLAAL